MMKKEEWFYLLSENEKKDHLKERSLSVIFEDKTGAKLLRRYGDSPFTYEEWRSGEKKPKKIP